MYPAYIGVIVFTCSLVGALFGMWLRSVLPAQHFDENSKDTIKRGVGLIATMTALVLGLITASAKESFDQVDSAIKQSAINIITFDRVLARYGPETAEIRQNFKQLISTRFEMIWPQDSSKESIMDPMYGGIGTGAEATATAIRNLVPKDESQTALCARALEMMETLLQVRWIVLARIDSSIPLLFLITLLLWLTIIFTSFGMFASRNATVIVVLVVCALSVGSAVFLVLEMDAPFDGLLKVSPEPMRKALEHRNQ